MRYGAIITTCLRPVRLRKALASVCNQTLPPTEILVVDDGKDDRLQQLMEREYPQAHIIPNRGTGISAARNTGIANTQQEWLSFLDDDDEWAFVKKSLSSSFAHKLVILLLFFLIIGLTAPIREKSPKEQRIKYYLSIYAFICLIAHIHHIPSEPSDHMPYHSIL